MRAARSTDIAPFLPTPQDLARFFHIGALQSGDALAQADTVTAIEFDAVSSNAMELRAQLLDAEHHRYQVGVRLSRKNAGALVEIESHCSCAIGHLCEHAAAALLHWQPQLRAAIATADTPGFARPWAGPADSEPMESAPSDEPAPRIAHGAGTVCVRLGAARLRRREDDLPGAPPPPAAVFVSLRIDGIRVPLQRAPSRMVIEGETVDIAPDVRQVERVITQLQAYGARPWSHPTPPPKRRTVDSAFEIDDEDAARLIDGPIATWRKQGWDVKIGEDFPWQLVSADELDVNVHNQKNRDWFDLELGIRVGERRFPLLPLLESALDDPESDTLQVRIDARRVVRLPRERVAPLLDTLIEIGDRHGQHRSAGKDAAAGGLGWRQRRAARMLPVARMDLARVATLTDRGVLTWSGPPDLRDFAHRLANFSALQAAPVPAMLRAQLRPYQQAGLNWLQFLRQYELGGLLADDMGLGKTLQTIAHICAEKEGGRLTAPALVIAPTSLVHNWMAEAARFAPELRCLQLHGTDRHREFSRIDESDLVVTSFALLARDADLLCEHRFHILIVDEAQAVKNPRTQAAGAIRNLQVTHRLAITGTPLENHLGELWAQFDWLTPGLLGDQASFTRLYRNPIEKRADEDRRAHLATRIRPFVLRRRKDEVAPELPPRTEIERYIELQGTQRDLYEAVRASMHERVRSALAEQGIERSQILVLDALLKLRQVCCDPRLTGLAGADAASESAKLESLLEMLDNLLADGRRVLLFSQFTSMLELIEEALRERGQQRDQDYALLTGETRDRAAQVERFQRGDVPLFLLSLKAGGTGLNLTSADTVIHYDPWWNPAVEAQASDRAHRIGQDKPVFIYRLLCAGTIEERMRALQARKAQLAEAMFGDEAGLARALTAEDIEALLAPAASLTPAPALP